MSVASVASRALAGIDAPEVTVEVHLGPGLPAFHIVGLPDTEVREARDRVRAALNHARFEFPARRITVNLAPAELPKDSSRFDLPIALGILAASGQLSPDSLAGQEFAGELSLTGELRAVRGALAMALSARAAGRIFVLPEGNAPQAALAEGARILPARTLLEVVAHLADEARLAEYSGGTEVSAEIRRSRRGSRNTSEDSYQPGCAVRSSHGRSAHGRSLNRSAAFAGRRRRRRY